MSKRSSFCTNCGAELQFHWKHCASCGQLVEIESKSNQSEIDLEQTELSNEDENNGDVTEELLSDEEAIVESENLPVAKENRSSSKSGLVFVALIVSFVVLVMIMGNLQKGSENLAVEQKPAPKKVQIDPEVEALRIKQDAFNTSLSSFLAAGCKPVITKEKGQPWDDNYVMANMTVEGVDGTGFARYATLYSPKVENWGNSVDKALVLAATYEELLAPLYWEIYGMWEQWNELGKYRTQFTKYLGKVDAIAKKLCYKSEGPSEAQMKLADTYMTQLIGDWDSFNTWLDKVWARETELSDELDYETTPRCREISTDNPDYNIVTCTNLP